MFFILLLFFLNNFNYFVSSDCPLNGLPGPNNNKCYYFISNTAGFIEAERTCTEIGGHLASVCNAYENSFLTDSSNRFLEYGQKDFLIGLNDQLINGVWNWTDPTISCYLYTNWAPNQPSSGDCTSVDIATRKWQTIDCSIEKSFICEADNSATKMPQCLDGYTYFRPTNFCYKTVNPGFSWDDASKNCQKDGGQLASIHSPNENEFLDSLTHQYVSKGAHWIGLHEIGTWYWSDGTEVSYTNYCPGNPTNKSTCIIMLQSDHPDANGTPCWVDWLPCNNLVGSVCKTYPVCK